MFEIIKIFVNLFFSFEMFFPFPTTFVFRDAPHPGLTSLHPMRLKKLHIEEI